MAINEDTLGTRISNAETFVMNLRKFTGFVPLRPEEATDEVEKLINQLKKTSLDEANTLQKYALAVDTRTKHFNKEDTSIKKIITSISAYIKGVYDKDSKEANTINQKVIELRGAKIKKDKTNPNEKSISTSQLSYASVTQNFAELIASLEGLSNPYNPPNALIKLEALKAKHQAAETANTLVKSTFSDLNGLRNQKKTLYEDLKNRCQRLKNSIKSQYGNASPEYIEIKGLTI
jgi:hypothetical protein